MCVNNIHQIIHNYKQKNRLRLSNCQSAALFGADAHTFLKVQNKNFTVAGLAGFSAFDNRIYRRLHKILIHRNLQAYFP